MRYKHPNLNYEAEIFNTGIISKSGGNFYQFYLVRQPQLLMDLCKNLNSDAEAIAYFDKIYQDEKWCNALYYLYK